MSVGDVFDRRAFLARSGLLAGGLVLGPSFLAACGRSNNAAAGAPSTDTLRFGFLADMQVPDPDIFYEGEGLIVTMSSYDNLIKYKADTSEFEAMLAKTWDVSPDALTYTFHL